MTEHALRYHAVEQSNLFFKVEPPLSLWGTTPRGSPDGTYIQDMLSSAASSVNVTSASANSLIVGLL